MSEGAAVSVGEMFSMLGRDYTVVFVDDGYFTAESVDGLSGMRLPVEDAAKLQWIDLSAGVCAAEEVGS